MSLIRELKRRSVFKVGIAYLVVAWLVLQIADVMMNMLAIPDFMGRVIIMLLTLGFPIAIVLAWALEVTPEGLKRDRGREPDAEPARRSRLAIELIVFSALIVVIGYLAVDKYRNHKANASQGASVEVRGDRSVTPERGTSIAVLPFVNMSSDPEQEYFSHGISEELLNVLSGVPGLTVASRTSSFAFREENRNIPEIAAILQVDHVLEGSVRKSGNQVRITAQLIDTNRDRHMWSETYDRELTDIFRIQDEISTAIVESLEDALGIDVPDDMGVETATTDMNAYEYYLKALSMWSSSQTMRTAKQTVDLLEQAVAADPTFAAAWVALADALVDLPTWFHSLDFDEYLDRAEQAAERSLELDDSLVEARMALAEIAFLRNDWEQWLAHLEWVQEQDPVSTSARDQQIAESWMGLGYLSRVLEMVDTESGRMTGDPFNYTLRGLALLSLGRSDDAMPVLQAAMIRGYAGGLQETVMMNFFGPQRRLAWAAEMAQYIQEYDPDLFPLLPYMEELVFVHPAEREERARRFWVVARELGFSREDLLTRGPVWGMRLRDSVLLALGEYETSAIAHFGNTPLYWVWTPDLRELRQSEAFRDRVRETGMLAFWRKHGWPDLCRAAGEDDFACD